MWNERKNGERIVLSLKRARALTLPPDRAQNRIGRGSGNVLNIEFVEGEMNTTKKIYL